MKLAWIAGLIFGFAAAAHADPLDASKPLDCALAEAAECDGVAACSDVAVAELEVPEVVRVDFATRQLASPDGARTSPIAAVETLETSLVLQGHQNGRGWTMVIDRATGHLSATIADADGAIVLAGACSGK
jgi:hypothetical protein